MNELAVWPRPRMVGGQLRACAYAELVEYFHQVMFDRDFTEAKTFRNFTIGLAQTDMQYIPITSVVMVILAYLNFLKL